MMLGVLNVQRENMRLEDKYPGVPLRIGDPVFVGERAADDGVTVLGSPARITRIPVTPDGLFEFQAPRERMTRTAWRDRIVLISEQDYFLMCMKYEPAPFYKED